VLYRRKKGNAQESSASRAFSFYEVVISLQNEHCYEELPLEYVMFRVVCTP